MRVIIGLVLCCLIPLSCLAQGVVKPKGGDLTVIGDAYLTDSEVVLTTRTNQRGEALYKPGICAKEYKLSMDVYVGDSTSTNHGAGLVWYELFEDTGNWGSVLEFNIADYARTFAFGTVELFKFVGANQVESINRVTPSFPLAGQGWYHVEIHVNEDTINALITHPRGVFSVANKRAYRPGIRINNRFLAWTGIKTDTYKWNWQDTIIEVIRPDNCSGASELTETEVLQKISHSCGTDECSVYPQFLDCAVNHLNSLKASGVIPLALYTSLITQYEAKMPYCDGTNQCLANLENERRSAYNEGFYDGKLEGVASIDVAGIKASSFADGVVSIDVNSIKHRSYIEGFAAGTSILDIESIKSIAFTQGVRSVDTNYYSNLGYQNGLAVCQAEISNKKVTICHKGNTNSISVNALNAHYSHGDQLGECLQPSKAKSRRKKLRED